MLSALVGGSAGELRNFSKLGVGRRYICSATTRIRVIKTLQISLSISETFRVLLVSPGPKISKKKTVEWEIRKKKKKKERPGYRTTESNLHCFTL